MQICVNIKFDPSLYNYMNILYDIAHYIIYVMYTLFMNDEMCGTESPICKVKIGISVVCMG